MEFSLMVMHIDLYRIIEHKVVLFGALLSNLTTHSSQEYQDEVILISLPDSRAPRSLAEFISKLGLRHQKPAAINTDVTNTDIWPFIQ